MKKNLFLIVALVALSAFAFAEVKIGIINPQAVLQNSTKGKEVIETAAGPAAGQAEEI